MVKDILISGKIEIPKWIAAKVYTLSDNEKFALIFNHKTNEYMILEKNSAILWEYIMSHSDYQEIIHFTADKNLKDEIADFLKELILYGFLVSDIYNLKKTELIAEKEFNTDADAYINFQSEIFSLLESNGFLSRLFIEMTYNCNLNCIHCYNDKQLKYKNVRYGDVKKIIDEACELGVFYITLSGGECTLNPDFLKIIEYIRQRKLTFELYTNGQTLYDDRALLNRIVDLYPYKISFSLYSMNPKIHDDITGINGSHKKTLSVISYLRERNINVEIKCFLMKQNASEYKQIQIFAQKNKCSLTFDYELLYNQTKSNKYVRITKEQLFKLFTDKESLLCIENSDKLNTDLKFKNGRICNGGHIGLLINPNLDIYICPSLKIPLGNCKKDSLTDVWNDKNTVTPLNKIKKLKKNDLKQCYKKEYCKYCNYCLGIAFMAGEYKNSYSVFCDEAKIKMKAFKLLNKKEK